MKLTLITAGRIKDRWISDGVEEYARRLRRYGGVTILEVADEKIPERYSPAQVREALEKEGERMLDRWPAGAWGVALDIDGRQLDSEGLAQLIETRAVSGSSHMVFAIGGSNGLAPSVRDRCRDRLSFGPLTFPHQLFRVMLLEQLYRAATIRAGHPYHK